MPVQIPERIIGQAGLAVIENYSDPRFVFTAITEIEDIFVNLFSKKFEDFVVDGELQDRPKVVPAWNPGDREFDVIVVEAALNSIGSQGIGYNKFEVQYQPNEDDPNSVEVYFGVSADAVYSADFYMRAVTRKRVTLISDWVIAALLDPLNQSLSVFGVEIPYNNVKMTGRIQQIKGPDGKDAVFGLTVSVSNLIVPWVRLYRNDAESISDIQMDISTD